MLLRNFKLRACLNLVGDTVGKLSGTVILLEETSWKQNGTDLRNFDLFHTPIPTFPRQGLKDGRFLTELSSKGGATYEDRLIGIWAYKVFSPVFLLAHRLISLFTYVAPSELRAGWVAFFL